MGRFFLLQILVIVGVPWLAGDRYGVPDRLVTLTDPAFSFVENKMADLLGKDQDQSSAETPLEDETSTSATEPEISAAQGDNSTLRMNDAGLKIIKKSEGLRLEAYESGGRSYIGYAHQMKPGDPRKITEAQAEALLRQDVKASEDGVRSRLTRPATSNQFSAMVSLAYNLGIGNFNKSRVLERFNAGDMQGAADAFLGHNKAGGKVIPHLTHRREEERALFLTN